jgi:hypothetical protein
MICNPTGSFAAEPRGTLAMGSGERHRERRADPVDIVLHLALDHLRDSSSPPETAEPERSA